MPEPGYVLYHGPSQLDGAPIVAILTPTSANPKTGPMAQTWILRADTEPLAAVDDGDDRSICGDCQHRGVVTARTGGREGRSCYVRVAWAPTNVWRGWILGRYRPGAPVVCPPVRLGAYGDPAAVPAIVWERLLATQSTPAWTGYTHQWRTCGTRYQAFLMASVDSLEETREARRRGWRTFRTRIDAEALRPDEIICPASDEAGHRVQCVRCRLCMGRARPAKSIAIRAHGQTAGWFVRRKQQELFP